MGLFTTEDGQHYRGWLAAFLCCCAALDVDEHPGERSKSRPSTRDATHVQYEQPTTIQPPPSYSHPMKQTKLHSQSHSLRNDSQELLINLRSPLKPLDFGLSTPSSPRTPRDGQMCKHGEASPNINPPTAFRRLDLSESQRRNLIPLKLAPVTLRNASSDDDMSLHEPTRRPTKHQRSDSTQELLSISQEVPGLSPPQESYRLSRESPYQRSKRQSNDMLQPPSATQPSSRDDIHYQHPNPPLSTYSSSNSLQRSTFEDTSSSTTSRSSHEQPSRVKRKHSGALSNRGDDLDLTGDRDAIELNTIHEDHKLDPPRPTTAKSDGHVPAVAPSMQVHARSETLSDIGSIFSRPLVLKDSKAFDELLEESDAQQQRSGAQGNRSRPRSNSARVSGWLSSIRTPSAASLSPTNTTEPSSYGGSKPSTPSRPTAPSIRTVESAASSPTSKSHSRTLTAESRMTSPPSTIHEIASDEDEMDAERRLARTEGQCLEEDWPSLRLSPSQVGLAF